MSSIPHYSHHCQENQKMRRPLCLFPVGKTSLPINTTHGDIDLLTHLQDQKYRTVGNRNVFHDTSRNYFDGRGTEHNVNLGVVTVQKTQFVPSPNSLSNPFNLKVDC